MQNALETNFKWGPWKRGSDDRDYSPFVIQQYEREGTKDVGEFKDIPASQSRFVVIDGQGGHHEFDSRSDAMKYAEKSFKEWKKMQKTKKNSLAQKKLAVIKSNAAPEVKLKALEVLSNMRAPISRHSSASDIAAALKKQFPKMADKQVIELTQKILMGEADDVLAKLKTHRNGVLSNEELSPEEIKKRFGEAKQKAKPFPIQELEKAQKEYETAKKDKSIDPEKLKKISDRYQDLLRKYQDSLKNSYKNADSKLDPAKLALSKMLEQFGYKAMARDVMQESDIQALKKYSRVVISEFEKAKSPKADRVKALLGQLGVGV